MYKKIIPLFVLFFFIFVLPVHTSPYNNILVTNFINESGYTGDWDLEQGFSRLVREYLIKTKQVIPLLRERSWKDDPSDLAKKFPDSLVISGKITDFSYTSSVMGALPFKYRNTEAKVEIDLEIIKDGELHARTCKGEEIKRDFLLNIFYKDEGDTDELENVTFGDSVFFLTLPGKATKKALDECAKEIEKYIE